VNIRNVDRLLKEDRMQPAGIRAYEGRKETDPAIYSYEQRSPELVEPLFGKTQTKQSGVEVFPGPAALLPQGYELVGCQCEERRDAT